MSGVTIEIGAIIAKTRSIGDALQVESFKQLSVHGVFSERERMWVPICVDDIDVFVIDGHAATFLIGFDLFHKLPFGICVVPR